MNQQPEPTVIFDNLAHRKNKNYTPGEFARRILWMLVSPLVRLSPRPLYGWRNLLLRFMGAKLGKAVRIYPSVDVFYPWNLEVGDYATIGPNVQVYSLGKVIIGAEALISQNVNLCAGTHDYRQSNLPLLKPPIRIGRGVWICADVFVGPGVTVGDFAILAARAVVVKDVEAQAIVAGNPARRIKYRYE
jgi:putative colanic acid biosynthesis acetyltransferase WcaF